MEWRYLAAVAVSSLMVLCACNTVPVSGSSDSHGGLNARPMLDMTGESAIDRAAKAHIDLGMAYFQLGRFDIALDEANLILTANNSFIPAAYHLRGLAYMMLNNPSAARDSFEKSVSGAPYDPDFNNSYGWFLCITNNYAEGVRRLGIAKVNPYYKYRSRPYANSGLCYLQQQKIPEAIEEFQSALSFNPTDTTALFNMGKIYYDQADYVKASYYLNALHRTSTFTPASLWLGVLTEKRLGKVADQLSYEKQLTSTFPDSEEADKLKQQQYE